MFEDRSPILGTEYNSGMIKCIQFILAQLLFGEQLDFELLCQTDSVSRQIYIEMNTGDRWWDMQDQHPAGATVGAVIFTSVKIHLTKLSGNKNPWWLYLTIGNI